MTVDTVYIEHQPMRCVVSERQIHGRTWWQAAVHLPEGDVIRGAHHGDPGAARASAWHRAKRIVEARSAG